MCARELDGVLAGVVKRRTVGVGGALKPPCNCLASLYSSGLRVAESEGNHKRWKELTTRSSSSAKKSSSSSSTRSLTSAAVNTGMALSTSATVF